MATTSFFYGGTTAPEQNTVDELIDALNQKVQAADESKSAAETAAGQAQAAATGAAISESNVAGLALQAQDTLDQANLAIATANTASETATTSAANAEDSASDAALSASAAASSATTAGTQATSATNSATTATTQAGIATTQADIATTQATNATTSATNAASSETAASSSATAAASSATSASTSATTATTKASEAAASAAAALASETASAASASASSAAQVAAETARDQTLAAYDNFDDRYLGAKASDPSLDNDGNALLAGALYFDSTLGYMKVYTGSAWVDAYAAGNSFLAKVNNLSDLPSAATARTNLGLGTAATTDASDYVTKTSDTGSAVMPAGTEAQRDGSPSAGYFRFNTDVDKFEGYNGTAWASVGGGAFDAFPTGTTMLFVQTTAPTGWTKSTDHDNKALRVVSGTAGSGGTVGFTTAFASKAVTGTNADTTATNIAVTATNNETTAGGTVGNTTLTITQIPSHTHVLRASIDAGTANASGAGDGQAPLNSTTSDATGGSGAHNHGFTGTAHNHTQAPHNHTQDGHTHTFTGTAIDLSVQYVDVIIAVKD